MAAIKYLKPKEKLQLSGYLKNILARLTILLPRFTGASQPDVCKMENNTTMFNFNLSVYINIGSNRYPTFVVCFLLFTIIVSANLVIILVISCERALHEPMYIFIAFLSINSLYGCTGLWWSF